MCPMRTHAPACSPAPCWACCLALLAQRDLGRCRQRAPPRLPPQPPHGGRTAAARRPHGRPYRSVPPAGATYSCLERGQKTGPPSLSPQSERPGSCAAARPLGERAGWGAPWAALPAVTGPALRRSNAAGSAARPAASLSMGRSPAPLPADPRSQAARAPPSVGAPAPGCTAAGNALASSAFGCCSGLPRCPSAPRGAAALSGS